MEKTARAAFSFLQAGEGVGQGDGKMCMYCTCNSVHVTCKQSVSTVDATCKWTIPHSIVNRMYVYVLYIECIWQSLTLYTYM